VDAIGLRLLDQEPQPGQLLGQLDHGGRVVAEQVLGQPRASHAVTVLGVVDRTLHDLAPLGQWHVFHQRQQVGFLNGTPRPTGAAGVASGEPAQQVTHYRLPSV
jgi:hypothetical protein